MCWYSAEHAGAVLQADVGQRLVFRRMHGAWSWAVRESDLTAVRPTPVCLRNGTEVIFRPTAEQQTQMCLPPEPRAVFRMVKQPKRDVFQLADGTQIDVDALPAGLLFDVLTIPGSEHLSTLLEPDWAPEEDEELVPARSGPAEPSLSFMRRLLRFV